MLSSPADLDTVPQEIFQVGLGPLDQLENDDPFLGWFDDQLGYCVMLKNKLDHDPGMKLLPHGNLEVLHPAALASLLKSPAVLERVFLLQRSVIFQCVFLLV